MYEPPDRWSPTLRQGDILGPVDIPMFGQRDTQAMHLGTIFGGVVTPANWVYPLKSNQYLMVLSHDCEFNEGKRERFLLARIVPANAFLGKELSIEDLFASNDVFERLDADLKVDANDAFALAELEGVFVRPHAVAFNTVAPFPAGVVDSFKLAKVAELAHSERMKLKAKLGYYFTRGHEDVAPEERLHRDDVLSRWNPEAPGGQ